MVTVADLIKNQQKRNRLPKIMNRKHKLSNPKIIGTQAKMYKSRSVQELKKNSESKEVMSVAPIRQLLEGGLKKLTSSRHDAAVKIYKEKLN